MFPDTVKESAYSALNTCITTVIPAIFPFSIISSLLISSKLFTEFSGWLNMGKPFGLSKKSSAPILFGCLFGFPIGAKTAAHLYKNGVIGKSEAEALLAVSNNCGPAFIVSVIGGAFYKSRILGMELYFLQLFSALIAGITVNRIIFPIKIENTNTEKQTEKPFIQSFTDAVKSSSAAMLDITAYICSFSVLGGIIKMLSDNHLLNTVILSILEITAGTRECSALIGRSGVALCAFTVGFSGLSVIFQAASFAIPEGLSIKRMIITKILQGILCCLLSFTVSAVVPTYPVFAQDISAMYSYLAASVIVMYIMKKSILLNKYKKIT